MPIFTRVQVWLAPYLDNSSRNCYLSSFKYDYSSSMEYKMKINKINVLVSDTARLASIKFKSARSLASKTAKNVIDTKKIEVKKLSARFINTVKHVDKNHKEVSDKV